MAKIIYRGHEIEHVHGKGWQVHKDGKIVTSQPSEEFAYHFVDRAKREEAGKTELPRYLRAATSYPSPAAAQAALAQFPGAIIKEHSDGTASIIELQDTPVQPGQQPWKG